MRLTKSSLRRQARTLRAELARAAPDAGERAAASIPDTVVAGASAASIYLPMRSEIDPEPIARRLRAAGVQILLPVVVERDAPLIFRAEGGPLAPDTAGLPAPAPGAEELDPDLVILPLLAFDMEGYRLGWGGGYYDRTLRALRARGTVLAAGLAFEAQKVERVPREAHDQRLDAVVTERGWRLF
ncbi:MAG: 5-formyltetrahydrofolate cyclo-ligase [Caulobacteraceae bacterium]|nr:5-formyltetrahydrofolate cyclo-ligase [Caulobacteraceae bacterium]